LIPVALILKALPEFYSHCTLLRPRAKIYLNTHKPERLYTQVFLTLFFLKIQSNALWWMVTYQKLVLWIDGMFH